jgi:signal transduction histidine kinase
VRFEVVPEPRPEPAVDVTDDGRGLAAGPLEAGSHVGLTSMRERAEELGGSLAVESKPGYGTRVRAWLPLRTAP